MLGSRISFEQNAKRFRHKQASFLALIYPAGMILLHAVRAERYSVSSRILFIMPPSDGTDSITVGTIST